MDIIGIDLGTTNSVATVYTDEGLKHISFDGDFLLPSVVNVSNEGVIVGIKAKNMAMIAEENTAISVKRMMGSDEKITLNGKKFSPEEVSSLIIKKIKATAEQEMGVEYKRCVVTVPAYFNENQRDATTQAVKLAGLEVLRVINEPTAAAISYGANRDEDILYGVYDLGGGTFDISIIENSEGLIEVLSTTGDNQLGGDDFDKKLASLIWEKSGFDITLTKKLQIKLNQLAEKVKIALSEEDSVTIDEKFFAKKDGEALHLEVEVTKEEFEALIDKDIDRTIELLLSTIEESNSDIDDLEAIILTGGSSRIPLISHKILEKTGKLPILIEDPDKSVSIGAILQGAMIEGVDTDSILVDITPYSLGIASLKGEYSMELSLSKIILKNTPVPTSKNSRYYAVTEYQKAFEIDVYQGEDEEELDANVKIGEMLLKIENPVEDGAIDVAFMLNQDGMLSVRGVEIHTGEVVQGEFKTKIARSSKHSKVKEMDILTEHDQTIIAKIDKVLENSEILDEDKEDLKVLKKQFISASTEDKEAIEEEIIDSIFFLEDVADGV
ncbi:Chaperone protein DnaK [hydrothermal vent metagenome]|uniref:Chaperone protein DnaK n=1 Tax=hydrothermal vent metagenome TaxID=652676 RepID=A0A1W1CLA2_9ZZZZ